MHSQETEAQRVQSHSHRLEPPYQEEVRDRGSLGQGKAGKMPPSFLRTVTLPIAG